MNTESDYTPGLLGSTRKDSTMKSNIGVSEYSDIHVTVPLGTQEKTEHFGVPLLITNEGLMSCCAGVTASLKKKSQKQLEAVFNPPPPDIFPLIPIINKSCNIGRCVNNMLRIIQNMIVSQCSEGLLYQVGFH